MIKNFINNYLVNTNELFSKLENTKITKTSTLKDLTNTKLKPAKHNFLIMIWFFKCAFEFYLLWINSLKNSKTGKILMVFVHPVIWLIIIMYKMFKFIFNLYRKIRYIIWTGSLWTLFNYDLATIESTFAVFLSSVSLFFSEIKAKLFELSMNIIARLFNNELPNPNVPSPSKTQEVVRKLHEKQPDPPIKYHDETLNKRPVKTYHEYNELLNLPEDEKPFYLRKWFLIGVDACVAIVGVAAIAYVYSSGGSPSEPTSDSNSNVKSINNDSLQSNELPYKQYKPKTTRNIHPQLILDTLVGPTLESTVSKIEEVTANSNLEIFESSYSKIEEIPAKKVDKGGGGKV